jgi:hypothetical protein
VPGPASNSLLEAGYRCLGDVEKEQNIIDGTVVQVALKGEKNYHSAGVQMFVLYTPTVKVNLSRLSMITYR